jgi:t-SNARE complex subunit (syntaxin)
MSFLYSKKAQKAIKWIWIVLSIIIILSMVVVYSASGLQ